MNSLLEVNNLNYLLTNYLLVPLNYSPQYFSSGLLLPHHNIYSAFSATSEHQYPEDVNLDKNNNNKKQKQKQK